MLLASEDAQTNNPALTNTNALCDTELRRPSECTQGGRAAQGDTTSSIKPNGSDSEFTPLDEVPEEDAPHEHLPSRQLATSVVLTPHAPATRTRSSSHDTRGLITPGRGDQDTAPSRPNHHCRGNANGHQLTQQNEPDALPSHANGRGSEPSNNTIPWYRWRFLGSGQTGHPTPSAATFRHTGHPLPPTTTGPSPTRTTKLAHSRAPLPHASR